MHDEAKAWLTLALASNGRPAEWLALSRDLGGARALVDAADRTLEAHGARPRAIAVLRAIDSSVCDRTIERCRRLGIRIAARGDASYPGALEHIEDSPLAVFWKGSDPAAAGPALAIVGARKCSAYGERTSRSIAREVAAAGVLVLSGLARGVDAAAHRGALETGRTAAVLAGGLDRVYPAEHRELAARVLAAGGFLLSEQPPGMPPVPRLFPYRNRLITGLAAATVVVEAGGRSGSIASAHHALAQGREVFAVPGPIDSPSSEGTNRLIAHGAPPFLDVTDLAVVGTLKESLEKKPAKSSRNGMNPGRELAPAEAAILASIGAREATVDEMIMGTRLDGTQVLTFLTALEMDGLVLRGDHGRFRLAQRRP